MAKEVPDFNKFTKLPRDLQKFTKMTKPNIPDLSAMPMPEIPISPVVLNVEQNLASEFHKRLVKWINDFDASLDNAHEVGVRLVTFGQTVVFHLDDLGYWNPSLISFGGHTEDDEPVELIQHVNQISVLLMKLPRKNPEAPKGKIGFHREVEDDASPDSE